MFIFIRGNVMFLAHEFDTSSSSQTNSSGTSLCWQVDNINSDFWFYIARTSTEFDEVMPATYSMVSCVEKLLLLAAEKNPLLADVQIVIPGHQTEQGHSIMEGLLAIWSGESVETGRLQHVYVFDVAGGKRYIQSRYPVSPDSVKNWTLIFEGIKLTQWSATASRHSEAG
jgi:hypothetical protein